MKKIESINLYDILEIPTDATLEEIKKAYKKMALMYHPDRVSKEEQQVANFNFIKIGKAYEILSNVDNREYYDRWGQSNDEDDNNNININNYQKYNNTFNEFFDFFNEIINNTGAKKSHSDSDIYKTKNITLEDLYLNKTIILGFKRKIECKNCHGNKTTCHIDKCSGCKGKGTVVIFNIGGTFLPIVRKCDKCNGDGFVIPNDKKCNNCDGTGIGEEKIIYEHELDANMKNNQNLIHVKDMGNFDLNTRSFGNLHLTINIDIHPFIKRCEKIQDLIYTKKICFAEALLDCYIYLPFFDNKILKIKKEKKVFTPSTVLKIPNQGLLETGLPENGKPSRGNLYIKFEIEWIQKLSNQQYKHLRHVFKDDLPISDSNNNCENIQDINSV